MMKIVAAAVLGALIFGATANASMIVQQGNNPQQPGQENVLLNLVSNQPTTVLGSTNQTGTVVNFTSTSAIVSPAQGQATIQSPSGSFNNLTVSLQNGGSFSSLILALDIAGAGTSCANCISFTANANEPGGGTANLTSSSFGAGPGLTFFTILAGGGETFNRVSLSSGTIGLQDVQQVRISLVNAVPIPEPASFLLTGGALALVALAAGRRLRIPRL